jgi:pimeloyl-ACP methyl ester carboxylesterase
MTSTPKLERPAIPFDANFITKGQGSPVILIHGLAASLHDWDSLIPRLASAGYTAYALDLLGHGDSAKPALPLYEMDWLVEHFVVWMDSLRLDEPVAVVGHSLGGYVALEYAWRFPERVSGLVLVDPFYSNDQLPIATRLAYAHPAISRFFTRSTPAWLVRSVIDIASLLMGHRTGGLHGLSKEVRAQTAIDYLRTAPASYGVLKAELDLRPHFPSVTMPALVVWGERDGTLAPASFKELVRRLPHATGLSSATGHVPHQADAEWFNLQVLSFLQSLGHDYGPSMDRLPADANPISSGLPQ